jgi:hypothetical protein
MASIDHKQFHQAQQIHSVFAGRQGRCFFDIDGLVYADG